MTTKRIHPKRINPSNSNEDGGTMAAAEVRRGPWTLEEDNLLIRYISCHGEGRWNSLAKSSGLNRTGKSCRLRWLNYLKPDIKRGNLTPQEQLLILELHSKWGNRWSKIAQHLPGRTDNEIKNYWRTRVQKQARQLKVDSNSEKFVEAIRMYWMPRLVEKMEQNSTTTDSSPPQGQGQGQGQGDHQAPPPPPPPPGEVNNNSSSSSSNWEDGGGEQCYRPSGSGYEMQNEWGMVGDIDWFGEDIGSTFWNTDELWQFRNGDDHDHDHHLLLGI